MVADDFWKRRYDELRLRWNAQMSPQEYRRERDDALGELAKCRAERQQAIDDAQSWIAERDESLRYIGKLTAERQQAIDERDAAVKRAVRLIEGQGLQEWMTQLDESEARCEQAIDALRDIEANAIAVADRRLARAALLSLGEQEQP